MVRNILKILQRMLKIFKVCPTILGRYVWKGSLQISGPCPFLRKKTNKTKQNKTKTKQN